MDSLNITSPDRCYRALIGTGGIAFTILLYSGLYYFGHVRRGGVYDALRSRLAETTMTSLVQAIEFYKAQHGSYPKSLEVLKNSLPEDSFTFVFDPTDVQMGGQPRYFYYEVVDADHYYLLGVGQDGQPFTRDDILPKVEVGLSSKVGLLIKQESKSGL